MTSEDRIFVYGTLRRGSGRRMQSVLSESARFVDEAVFRGRLYRVAHYPGAVASDDPRDRVVGDVFRLLDPIRLLPRLDRYEGCDPGDSRAPYVRRLCRVTLGSGEEIRAWIYLYNRDTANLERIPSGDFLGSVPPAVR